MLSGGVKVYFGGEEAIGLTQFCEVYGRTLDIVKAYNAYRNILRKKFPTDKRFEVDARPVICKKNGKELLEREDVSLYLQDMKRRELDSEMGVHDAISWHRDVRLLLDACMGKPIAVQTFAGGSSKGSKGSGFVNLVEDCEVDCPHCGMFVTVNKTMYKFDSSGAAKALEMMGKNLQLLNTNVVITNGLDMEKVGKLNTEKQTLLFSLIREMNS